MVLKKPGQSDAAEPAKPATSDTSFMEHLVKKSLDVNRAFGLDAQQEVLAKASAEEQSRMRRPASLMLR